MWSHFTRLRDPLLCETTAAARDAGLDDSFAMIRLTDQLVVIDLEQVSALGLGDLAIEVLAHEIGHHILCPASLTAQGRLLARVRWALPSVEPAAPAIANLYADLHINDRLQRSSGLRMADVYRRLRARSPSGPVSDLWRLYMRIYEILWALPRGDVGAGTVARSARGRRAARQPPGARLPDGLARRRRRLRRDVPALPHRRRRRPRRARRVGRRDPCHRGRRSRRPHRARPGRAGRAAAPGPRPARHRCPRHEGPGARARGRCDTRRRAGTASGALRVRRAVAGARPEPHRPRGRRALLPGGGPAVPDPVPDAADAVGR